ncbi:MAG TPA: PEP-CTERM sorting domain-containing protein [Planctomycetota bacterium]|nr:PEP-CTERM sorting domain-containing protein [Planctomycetota bacterium]
MRRVWLSGLVGVMAVLWSAGASAGLFQTFIFEDFNTDPTARGVVFNDNAAWISASGHGRLTPESGNQKGSIIFPTTFSSQSVDYIAKVYIQNTTGSPADGVTTAILDQSLGTSASAFAVGLDLFIPNTTGGAKHIGVPYDTWQNSGEPAVPNSSVLYNMGGGANRINTTGQLTSLIDNAANVNVRGYTTSVQIRGDDDTGQAAVASWYGNVEADRGGSPAFLQPLTQGTVPSYATFDARLGFGARTGGSDEYAAIDDVGAVVRDQAAIGSLPVAHQQDFSAWSGAWVLNGDATVAGGQLSLARPSGPTGAGSAFLSGQLTSPTFALGFDFTILPGASSTEEGFTVCFAGSPSALGGGGGSGGCGYTGILGNSFAIAFDLAPELPGGTAGDRSPVIRLLQNGTAVDAANSLVYYDLPDLIDSGLYHADVYFDQGLLAVYLSSESGSVSDTLVLAGQLADFTFSPGTLGFTGGSASEALEIRIDNVLLQGEFNTEVIPEPASLALLGLGLAALARRRRKH